jgi:hypothetical protein
MEPDTTDFGHTLLADSTQLNADDLIGGPIVVQITRVDVKPKGQAKPKKGDQPVTIHITGGHKPYRPCLSLRRVFASVWGLGTGAWIGRTLVLFRDETVTFGDDPVGGIRVSHMSDLAEPSMTVMVNESRGKKTAITVRRYVPPRETPTVMPLNSLRGWLQKAIKEGVWTRDQVGALLIEHGANPTAADKSESLPEDKRATVAEIVKKPPPSQDEGPPDGAGIDPW